MLETRELEFQEEASVKVALSLYTDNNTNFADCPHIAAAFEHGHAPLMTFDRKASRLKEAELLVSLDTSGIGQQRTFTRTEVSIFKFANGLQGRTGFVEFWSNYQQLCLELLDAAYVPVHVISSRSWNDDDLEVLAAKLGLLPEQL